ncbi:MAG: hypothetical protein J5I98_35160 [Phaeodactylibacter sp.]|nr:hypothetical protein [Phaeodactylibacter sp.]
MTSKNLMHPFALPPDGLLVAGNKDDEPTPSDKLPFPLPEKTASPGTANRRSA